jgi:protoporphyrinogen oxidase
MTDMKTTDVVVVGAGFTGLSAAYELALRGVRVTVLDAASEIGGLAAAFDFEGTRLDRFYHHWFTSDEHALELVHELGLQDRLETHATSTGMYFANTIFRLSNPLDVLRFTPLPFAARLRLGLLALRARRVRDWRALEGLTAREWLLALGGETVFRVVWQPLLEGKFGPYANDISAVWFWNKLKLRGGSRGKHGEERLAYLRGGFIEVAYAMADRIRQAGGHVRTGARVVSTKPGSSGWTTTASTGTWHSAKVLVTTALPQVADLVADWASPAVLQKLRRIRYLGNICLILVLDRPLSSTYWLNVNDPGFPFVGVIEHTNFEDAVTYGGKHVVYLSKYLPVEDPLYSKDADGFLAYALPYLKRMFPALQDDWVLKHHLWKAEWSQPIVERHYSDMIPAQTDLADGLYLSSMAQIYPEDRGTNYAIREGRQVGRQIAKHLETTP